MNELHEKAEDYIQKGREIEEHGPLSVISKALLLYRLSGKAEGYGTAMLDRATDYQPRVGPDCMKAADMLLAMAERVLGYEKPEGPF